jgi:hypothetical protein
MSETENHGALPSAGRDLHKIAYAYGGSSLGDFLAAVDSQGLCAIFFGDNQAALLGNLHQAFPDKILAPACSTFAGFIVSVVTTLSPADRCSEASRQTLPAPEATVKAFSPTRSQAAAMAGVAWANI